MKRYMSNRLLFILIYTFAALSCGQVKDVSFVRTDGTRLVLDDGTEFIIRGTNLGNWLNPEGYLFKFPKKASSFRSIDEGLSQIVGPVYMERFWEQFIDNYVTEKDIGFLSSLGINTLRLPFHYKLFTADRYMGSVDDDMGFDVIDRLVAWCKKYGVRLILDMHDCPGGQTGDNIDDSYGYPWLFREPDAREQFIDIWSRVAERYADEPVILGYDLMNEPIAHYFEDKDDLNAELQPLMIRTVESIRKVDKRHVIILGGAQWNTNFNVYDDFSFDENIMYSCHIYKCPPTAGSVRQFVTFRQLSNRPMFMGETGENTDEWVEKFRKTLENNSIGWTFWTYKRLDATATFLNITEPEGWDIISEFLAADRTEYSAVRRNCPDRERCREILNNYIENIGFDKCDINASYVEALGFKVKDYE